MSHLRSRVTLLLHAKRLLGPKLFFQKLKYHIHSRTPYLCLCKELKAGSPQPLQKNSVVLTPAKSRDVNDFLSIMSSESSSSRYEMLARRWFYELGFHDCYIGRIIGSGEKCGIVWQVTNRDIERTGSQGLFERLQRDEVYGENVYILEKFRGRGVMNAIGRCHESMSYAQGFRRMYFFVRMDNAASLKSSLRRGHRVAYRFDRCHFLCRVSNRIIMRFNPAIPFERLLGDASQERTAGREMKAYGASSL